MEIKNKVIEELVELYNVRIFYLIKYCQQNHVTSETDNDKISQNKILKINAKKQKQSKSI